MAKIFKFLLLLIFTVNTLFAVSINTTKDSFKRGESITVAVTGLPDTANCNDDDYDDQDGSRKDNDCNWVGLFYAYDGSEDRNLLTFQYADTNANQTFTFDGLDEASEYEVRLFFKNSFDEQEFYPFKITEAIATEIQIKTIKDNYKIGEPISAQVSGLPGNDDDWIGLFYAYDDNKPEHVVYKIETKGKKEGSFTFPALSEVYEYEVRAFVNGTYEEEDYYPFKVIKNVVEESSVIINEVMAINAHKIIDPDFSKFSDWIELYNSSSESIDLSGYKLSDKVTEAKWTIPNGTTLKAKSYMLFWADEEDTSLIDHHTNFKLKGKGEAVALFDPNGRLIDSIEFGKQEVDISCAKNGGTVGYMHATPKKKNWDISNEYISSGEPEFSKEGGFYDDGVSVKLTAEAGAKIYYTTNGSYPTYGSKRYTGSINIDKTTVLRAMSVKSGEFISKRVTHTYFIDEDITLPTISIITDNKYLFDDMVGIYTIGTNGASRICKEGNANYMQDWKRPANIEYFSKSKQLGFSQEVDIEISGNCSRNMAQKSLKIKADDKYGKESIDYKLFAEKDIDEFKSFKLRNSGQDWWKTMFRDPMIQQLVKDLDVDYQAYEPSIVFINGKYYGIHNIREMKNEDYLENNYPDLNPKKVDILYGYADVKEGRADEYEDLIDFIDNNHLSDDYDYNHVASKIDISNYIDYQITQIFIVNSDWPHSNIRFWKEQKDGAKWRWMLDDQDYGFDIYDRGLGREGKISISHNMLEFATEKYSDNYRNPRWATFLLRNLMKNDNFKDAFVTRYNELLRSTFTTQKMTSLINQMKSVIEPEMPRHIEKWGSKGPSYEDVDEWNENIDVMLFFAQERPSIAKKHLDEF